MFITRYTKQFLIVAVGIVLAAAIALGTYGVTLGIDFTGGALTEVSYTARPDKASVETLLDTRNLGGYSLRVSDDLSGNEAYILRTRHLTETERQEVTATLTGVGEGGAVARYTSIGPVIGQELRSKAVWAVGAVALVIVLYVAFAFRGVRRPVRSWVYGLITVLALFHDVLVPTAVFGVLGYFFGAEVDVLFIMAILAVLGYSVNDTIVVFDRVRENLELNQKNKHKEPFADTVGRALSQTFVRSINTSLTTLLALSALYFVGGDSTKNFALVLLIGVIAGTYSSIFIASPLLVAIEKWQRVRAGAHRKESQ